MIHNYYVCAHLVQKDSIYSYYRKVCGGGDGLEGGNASV